MNNVKTTSTSMKSNFNLCKIESQDVLIFFFNKLENRYTSIHHDDNWYAKVPFIQWLSRCCTLQLSEVRWRGEEVYQIKSQPWRTHLSGVCLYSITMNVHFLSLIVLVLHFPLLFSFLPRVCHFRPPPAQNFHWVAVPKCRLLRQPQGPSHGLS